MQPGPTLIARVRPRGKIAQQDYRKCWEDHTFCPLAVGRPWTQISGALSKVKPRRLISDSFLIHGTSQDFVNPCCCHHVLLLRMLRTMMMPCLLLRVTSGVVVQSTTLFILCNRGIFPRLRLRHADWLQHAWYRKGILSCSGGKVSVRFVVAAAPGPALTLLKPAENMLPI